MQNLSRQLIARGAVHFVEEILDARSIAAPARCFESAANSIEQPQFSQRNVGKRVALHSLALLAPYPANQRQLALDAAHTAMTGGGNLDIRRSRESFECNLSKSF